MKIDRKFRLLFTLLLVLCLLLVVHVFDTTLSRYIKQERDEIYATYTSLYFESDIKNGSVVLENNTAYFNFKLRNFVGEDITKRAVDYTIKNPSYVTETKETINVDEFGNMTVNGNPYTGNQYVLDVWGEPQLVGSDSHNYDIQILDNDGMKISSNQYRFPYEVGTEGQAANHTVTVKITRIAPDELSANENISIVVQLNSPYEEVYIINIKIMNHLISYSLTTKDTYETTFDVIGIQTANIFSHEYKKSLGTYIPREITIIENEVVDEVNKEVEYIYAFTSKPFMIDYKFSGFLLERLNLNDLHMDIFDLIKGEDRENIINNYLGELNNDSTNGNVVIYVPQSSNFYIELFKTSDTYSISSMVYVYLEKYSVDNNGNKLTKVSEGYYPYTTTFGGYEELNGVDGEGKPIYTTIITSSGN